jgi:DNA-binding transcriptional ArsR family regulator
MLEDVMPYVTVDLVFATLADPTRRAVVERLVNGPAPVKELAEPHDMALPSFLQHIDILESRRLIRTRKIGRQRMCQLEPLALLPLEAWLDRQRRNWERRLSELATAEEMDLWRDGFRGLKEERR